MLRHHQLRIRQQNRNKEEREVLFHATHSDPTGAQRDQRWERILQLVGAVSELRDTRIALSRGRLFTCFVLPVTDLDAGVALGHHRLLVEPPLIANEFRGEQVYMLDSMLNSSVA